MNQSCRFCEENIMHKSSFFENEYFYAIFDRHPVSSGHALIIPKRHIVSFFDLSPIEWQELFTFLKKAVSLVESTDLKVLYTDFIKNSVSEKSTLFCTKILESGNTNRKPDGYNFGNNDGVAAGRTIHHLHIHIIPRYIGDVENPIGGIRNIIPGMGDYKV